MLMLNVSCATQNGENKEFPYLAIIAIILIGKVCNDLKLKKCDVAITAHE